MEPATVAFRAITWEAGFIKALSAVIGRLKGVNGFVMSTMTTEFEAPVSLTQMNFSLSMVTFVKVINCCAMPMLGSCKQNGP